MLKSVEQVFRKVSTIYVAPFISDADNHCGDGLVDWRRDGTAEDAPLWKYDPTQTLRREFLVFLEGNGAGSRAYGRRERVGVEEGPTRIRFGDICCDFCDLEGSGRRVPLADALTTF